MSAGAGEHAYKAPRTEADYDLLPRRMYGMFMPRGSTLRRADRAREIDAQLGSEALLKAIRRYFERRANG